MKINIFKIMLVLVSMVFATVSYAGEAPVKNIKKTVAAKKSRAPASVQAAEFAYTKQPVVCKTSEQDSFCFGIGSNGKVSGYLVCPKVNNACPSANDCAADPTDADATIDILAGYNGPNEAGCDFYKSLGIPPNVSHGGDSPRGGGGGGLGNGGGR